MGTRHLTETIRFMKALLRYAMPLVAAAQLMTAVACAQDNKAQPKQDTLPKKTTKLALTAAIEGNALIRDYGVRMGTYAVGFDASRRDIFPNRPGGSLLTIKFRRYLGSQQGREDVSDYTWNDPRWQDEYDMVQTLKWSAFACVAPEFPLHRNKKKDPVVYLKPSVGLGVVHVGQYGWLHSKRSRTPFAADLSVALNGRITDDVRVSAKYAYFDANDFGFWKQYNNYAAASLGLEVDLVSKTKIKTPKYSTSGEVFIPDTGASQSSNADDAKEKKRKKEKKEKDRSADWDESDHVGVAVTVQHNTLLSDEYNRFGSYAVGLDVYRRFDFVDQNAGTLALKSRYFTGQKQGREKVDDYQWYDPRWRTSNDRVQTVNWSVLACFQPQFVILRNKNQKPVLSANASLGLGVMSSDFRGSYKDPVSGVSFAREVYAGLSADITKDVRIHAGWTILGTTQTQRDDCSFVSAGISVDLLKFKNE
jgi:hypothetical protein